MPVRVAAAAQLPEWPSLVTDISVNGAGNEMLKIGSLKGPGSLEILCPTLRAHRRCIQASLTALSARSPL